VDLGKVKRPKEKTPLVRPSLPKRLAKRHSKKILGTLQGESLSEILEGLFTSEARGGKNASKKSFALIPCKKKDKPGGKRYASVPPLFGGILSSKETKGQVTTEKRNTKGQRGIVQWKDKKGCLDSQDVHKRRRSEWQ